jgi:hypothetical protein
MSDEPACKVDELMGLGVGKGERRLKWEQPSSGDFFSEMSFPALL